MHKVLSMKLSPPELQYLEDPVDGDITKPETLSAAIDDADVVVSMVGLMHGTVEDFERIQWQGAENVARAARRARAKLIHISAIGANSSSNVRLQKLLVFLLLLVTLRPPDRLLALQVMLLRRRRLRTSLSRLLYKRQQLLSLQDRRSPKFDLL